MNPSTSCFLRFETDNEQMKVDVSKESYWISFPCRPITYLRNITAITLETQNSRTTAVIPSNECIVQVKKYKVHLHSFTSPWDVILQMQFWQPISSMGIWIINFKSQFKVFLRCLKHLQTGTTSISWESNPNYRKKTEKVHRKCNQNQSNKSKAACCSVKAIPLASGQWHTFL